VDDGNGFAFVQGGRETHGGASFDDGGGWHASHSAPINILRAPRGFGGQEWIGHDDGPLYRHDGVDFRFGFSLFGDGGYPPRWHFRRYGYEPGFAVVISPWYYYPELPPYLDSSSVVESQPLDVPSAWEPYDYAYPGDSEWTYSENPVQQTFDESGRPPIDAAIDHVVEAFADANARDADVELPRDGDVRIIENGDQYSLSAHDFYQMFSDLVSNTHSDGYHVLSVEVSDDVIHVLARHDRLDPWNRNESVYHQYWLYNEYGNYVIRQFSTSGTRPE